MFIAAESVMDQIWGIPPRRRPGFVAVRLRALLLGLVLGSGAVGTSALNAFGTVGAGHGLLWRIGSFAFSTAANVALFWLAFRLLTADQVSWRQLRGGAVLAAFAWELLLAGGSLYVHYVVASASNTYGTFAGVIGLLSFIYLSADHIARGRDQRRCDPAALAAESSVRGRRPSHGRRSNCARASRGSRRRRVPRDRRRHWQPGQHRR